MDQYHPHTINPSPRTVPGTEIRDQAVCRSVSSALAIHGVCTVLWVGSPWDPKYMLLLTFTTLNVLSDPCGKFRLHKSRNTNNLQRCLGIRRVPINRSSMSPSMDLPRYSAYVPPTNYRHLESDFFDWFSDFRWIYHRGRSHKNDTLMNLPTALFAPCSQFS